MMQSRRHWPISGAIGSNDIGMSRNFKLVIEYDGTRYCGWQRQADRPTIQAEIERVLSLLTRQQITLKGSGRTDAGVHAWGQTANFHCETRLSSQNFLHALNSLLPDDIVIRNCREVPADFHARYDVVAKTYHYHILNLPIPSVVERHFSWHIQRPLNLGAMNQALFCLIGTHDFKAFEGAGSPRAHTVRTIYRAEILDKGNGRLMVVVTGDGFLRYMVRNIVGTLVNIGMEKWTSSDMERILLSMDRNLAGATAPAQGLFLAEVQYEWTE
jgi:tRNA pseudouridine38-40 synthase